MEVGSKIRHILRTNLAIAIACLFSGWSAALYALDAGVIVTHSAKNEALRAEIPLVDAEGFALDELDVIIAADDLYETMGIDKTEVIDTFFISVAKRE
ncbi:MAG: hypothetical protein OEZ47_16720, partial [Gammaproteobacteria bacterium]|nr:hypothetical protein [Gammaproteobacteria bacterium]